LSRTLCWSWAFFFQAEDGIRDFHVTGVQTCALPILKLRQFCSLPVSIAAIFCAIPSKVCVAALFTCDILSVALSSHSLQPDFRRSEERRVGKECRSRWSR